MIFPRTQGIGFLGYRIFPSHRLLAKENVKRFRRRMRRLQAQYAAGLVPVEELTQRITSWIAHAGHAGTYRLRARLFDEFAFTRSSTAEGAPSVDLVATGGI